MTGTAETTGDTGAGTLPGPPPSGTVAVREDSLTPAAVEARISYARALSASGLLPDAYRGQPANVLLAIEYAQALGIRPIAALNGINVIKGRPTLSADLMASVVRQAGHRLRVTQDGMTATAMLTRADDPEFTYTVTWDEARARRAGLWGQRGPWSLYPEQMLRSRAVTEVCRQGASDCLYGAIYAPEEIEATTTGADSGPQAGDYQGPDDTVARLRQECQRLVESFTARFGGSVEDLAAEWTRVNGTADPVALRAWLTARIPTQTTQDQDTATHAPEDDEDVVDAETITGGDSHDHH